MRPVSVSLYVGPVDQPEAPAVVAAGGGIGDLLITAIERYGGKCAFVDGETPYTYDDLGHDISRALQLLADLGASRGDTVALLSSNSPQTFVLMAAVYIGGMRLVTLHTTASTADLARVIDDSDASLCVYSVAQAHRAPDLMMRCPKVRVWSCDEDHETALGFWSAAAQYSPEPLLSVGGAEDIVRLAYTGGTSGRPKGVMLSNRALATNVLHILAEREWPSHPRMICATPISHGAGSQLTPVLCRGGTILLQQTFVVEGFLQAIVEWRMNMTWVVPTMIYDLLDHPRTQDVDWSRFHTVIYSGAPIAPQRLKEALQRFGPILLQAYGQSEAPNSVLALGRADHLVESRLTSAGRPMPGLLVRLFDDRDCEVPRGEVGEICVRGPIVMSGYWRQPELTAETLRGGWLHTGDMARQDDEGCFHIVDRKKDMIITGGFNVYSTEVESVLALHDAVAESMVIGIPHERWGEAVSAFVVRRPGRDVEADELIAFVRERKGALHAPKAVVFVDSLPKTSLGKPDKKELRSSVASAGIAP